MYRRLLLAALCSGLPFALTAAEVTLAGSDLVRPALEKTFAQESANGPSVTLRLEGSRRGLDDLRAGRADLAVVVFAPDELPPDKEFRLLPLAYQVAVFAVTDTNPVRQVSFGQLGGMFGDKESVNYRQWGALGAKDVWEQKSISLNMIEDPDSLAVELFKAVALQVPALKTTINVQPNLSELLRRVRVDDTCIGLFPRPLAETDGIHVLLIARSDRDVPFGPTPENVHNGDYPLRLPFYLAFKPADAAKIAPVVTQLFGDDGAAALTAAGFMPVPASARSEAIGAAGAR